MEPISLLEELSELMSAHNINFHIVGEWITPYGKLPAIRATWYPREENGRLEIDVLLEDRRIINECFAGIGAGRSGLNDALQNFCVNSFHVLLASFWEINDPDQVMTECWNIAGKEYTTYIGNFGTRGNASAGVGTKIPAGLFEAIEKAIKSEPLSDQYSWFRCFFCDLSGEQTFEALKNNEVWESGMQALKSLPWVKTNGYYSVRIFLLLRENE